MKELSAIIALIVGFAATPAAAYNGSCDDELQTCTFDTPVCAKGSKCHYTYSVGVNSTVQVNYHCASGTKKLKHVKCSSPNFYVDSCTWTTSSQCSCGPTTTDNPYDMNVTAHCTD